MRGSPTGDLYIITYVRPHDTFTRHENDLHVEVPLDFITAALGGELDVPTLDGSTRLKIPSGTQSETVFKLKNHGMPYLRGSGRGNQHIKVRISVPTKLSKKQKELLEEFGKTKPKKGWFS